MVGSIIVLIVSILSLIVSLVLFDGVSIAIAIFLLIASIMGIRKKEASIAVVIIGCSLISMIFNFGILNLILMLIALIGGIVFVASTYVQKEGDVA